MQTDPNWSNFFYNPQSDQVFLVNGYINMLIYHTIESIKQYFNILPFYSKQKYFSKEYFEKRMICIYVNI